MAGPVKHLHYDGQPFADCRSSSGVVARGPERLLASDEGGELAAARQSAIHNCTMTGSHSPTAGARPGWLREDRSVCWRVTKEVNWRLPVRVPCSLCLMARSARCDVRWGSRRLRRIQRNDYSGEPALFLTRFVGFSCRSAARTSGTRIAPGRYLRRRRSPTISMSAHSSSAQRRAIRVTGSTFRRGSDSAAECVSRLDYSRIRVRL
jgi:hypothetical protein